MRYLILALLLLLCASNIYAHGSSHYVCTYERVELDLIKHCTSYDKPQPDQRLVNYYSDEQVKQREHDNNIFIGFLSILGIGVVILLGLLIATILEE